MLAFRRSAGLRSARPLRSTPRSRVRSRALVCAVRAQSSSALAVQKLGQVPSTAALQPLLSDAERKEITRIIDEHKEAVLNPDPEWSDKYHHSSSVYENSRPITEDFASRERNVAHFGWYPFVGFGWTILWTKELILMDEMMFGVSVCCFVWYLLYIVAVPIRLQHKKTKEGKKFDVAITKHWKTWYGMANFWETFHKVKLEQNTKYMNVASYLRKYAEIYTALSGQLADTQRVNAEAEVTKDAETAIRTLIQTETKAVQQQAAEDAAALGDNLSVWFSEAPDAFKQQYLDYAIDSLWLTDPQQTNPVDAYVAKKEAEQ